MGPKNSPVRKILLDIAEQIIIEEGYAAVTSRKVAEKAGMKQPVVYYYFKSMDDLILTSFRRHMQRYYTRFVKAFASAKPLQAYWEASTDPDGTVLSREYIALASHNEMIRIEIKRFGEVLYRMQVEGLSKVIKKTVLFGGIPCSAAVLTNTLNAIARRLTLESATEISNGHTEMQAFIRKLIERIE